MTGAVTLDSWVLLLAGIAGVITAGTPGFLAWIEARKTKHLWNSRLDEFKLLITESEFTKGKTAGRAEERAEVAMQAKAVANEKEKEKEKEP